VKVMNWAYWGGVGVVASDGYRARMAQLGIGSIEPADGMAALDALLDGPLHWLAYMKTTGAQRPQAPWSDHQLQVYQAGFASTIGALRPVPPEAGQADGGNEELLASMEARLRTLTAELLQVGSEEIDVHESLSEYGMDTVLLTELANRINQTYSLDLTAHALQPHAAHPTLTSSEE
jgi:polyketide synthase PksM